jgi:hypothetical protein
MVEKFGWRFGAVWVKPWWRNLGEAMVEEEWRELPVLIVVMLVLQG